MRKILIIGSKGMAGHIIYHYFKENSNFLIIDIARGTDFHTPKYQIDVTNFDRLKEILKLEEPSHVINCIGVLNKDAEENPEKSILLNSYFPHFLAKVGKEIGFKLIHISTDCVFNGQKGNYLENSVKDGVGFYAQTKALGEVTYENNLTIRTSIIGPELKGNGIGLFHWFMNQHGNINGYSSALWTGVTTLELAKGMLEAINQDISGIQHFVNNDKINKYELTSLFKKVFKRESIYISPYDDYKVDKSLIRSNFDFKYEVPSYEIMISEMKEWIDNHTNLYAY